MPNVGRQAVGLFANRRVPHICPNLADVGRAEGPSRLSRNFRSAVAHRSRKYFRITCVDDFYFRFKYITAAPSRGASYAFENTIPSRKQLQNQMHGPGPKNRDPMESNNCTSSGGRGGRGVGGPLHITFVRWRAWELTRVPRGCSPLRNSVGTGGRVGAYPFIRSSHRSSIGVWLFPIEVLLEWVFPPNV